MYQPPGANPDELGDIDVFTDDDTIHLFHLCLPSHDIIAHLTSSDGLSWEPAPNALQIGEPGECDDDMLWTMHTVKMPDGSGYRMYYTALSSKEHGQVQRVALAESLDLFQWRKYPGNPILESKLPYYNEDRELVGYISFRDPFVFIEDGVWHMIVCAREARGPRFRRGCVAHATSSDGIDWELLPPLYAPAQFEDLEVPTMLKLGGKYYLFFLVLGTMKNLYRVSGSLEGPWEAPQRELLLPPGNCGFRFCHWKGRTLLFHWIRTLPDWHKRGGQRYAGLAPPKEVEVDDNGHLRLLSFSGWENYYNGDTQYLPAELFLKRALGAGKFQKSDRGGLSARACGSAIASSDVKASDFILELNLRQLRGKASGIAFRTDDQLDVANWLRLDFDNAVLELHRTRVFDSSFHRYKLQHPTLLQSAPLALRHGESYRLRILASREHIEVSLNETVYLSAVSYHAKEGGLAAIVEDGEAEFSEFNLQPLLHPGI